jgi:hypothetical protein
VFAAKPGRLTTRRLLKKSEKGILSRRLTPMNTDKPILFNLRLSAFIGG